MRQEQSPDDLRDRLVGMLTSPWAPVAAGLLFLLAIGIALLSVLLGSRAEDERDALAAIIREARAGNHLQASQLALSMRRPPEQLPKLLEWFYFNDPDTPLDQIDLPTLSAFIDANQHWPGTRTLEIKREAKLAREKAASRVVEERRLESLRDGNVTSTRARAREIEDHMVRKREGIRATGLRWALVRASVDP